MKYNGIELKEFTSDKPVVFNPPRTMLVWDRTDSEPCERDVVGYLPLREYRKVITRGDEYMFCAEIPETPKSRRATNRELAEWLVRGNGEYLCLLSNMVHDNYSYYYNFEDEECHNSVRVRKWYDKEWHQPTADYMGLED
jgi:hypothetical protein